MPTITADDGTSLHYEVTGNGPPVVFVHEFGGDARSLDPQVRQFARRYRCVTFNARGFPPSGVPTSLQSYSLERSVADLTNVMDALEISEAHIVGLSMGAFPVLELALAHPGRVTSMLLAAYGYGVEPQGNAEFRKQVEAGAELIRTKGMAAFADTYSQAPTRVQFENKDPSGFAEFKNHLAQRDATGAELTMRGVQLTRRPRDEALTRKLETIQIPTLIVTGDEDEPTLEPSLFLKRTIRSAQLAIIPGTGHTLNLEEPDAFNQHLDRFLQQVVAGRWLCRDPRSMSKSTLGVEQVR